MRHGLMCVGPTGGGKTVAYEVLKDALLALHKDGHDHYFYQPVHTYVLNPKVHTYIRGLMIDMQAYVLMNTSVI